MHELLHAGFEKVRTTVLRNVKRIQPLVVLLILILHLMLVSINAYADKNADINNLRALKGSQASVSVDAIKPQTNASLESPVKDSGQAPPPKVRRGFAHIFTHLCLAIIGVLLIGMASSGLAWGFRAHLQLQKEREKSRNDIKRLMCELDLSYAKKNQIITTMSHSIRQPLQTLSYLTASLPEQNSELSQLHQQINTVTQELNLLVNALYNLSKFDNELVLPNISIVNVAHVLQDISHSYFSLVTAQGIQLHVNHQNAWLKTDAHLLKHAVGLLVENAIKHSGASHIWVEASINDEGSAVIKVRDNGKGIPLEDWSKIFDEFYMADQENLAANQKSRKTSAKKEVLPKVGMGLGLALFARIADLLDIKYHVTQPGAGALHETMIGGPGLEFVLEMPELALAKEVHSESIKTMEEKRRRREIFENRFENNVGVWIVEPNHSVASALSQMVQQWGVQPHAFTDCSDVKSGLSRLEAPDLILTNAFVTGVENVESLVALIRRHYKNEIEACVISNSMLESSIVRDDIHYLVNPISPGKIFDILYHVVDYKREVARKKRFVKKIQQVD